MLSRWPAAGRDVPVSADHQGDSAGREQSARLFLIEPMSCLQRSARARLASAVGGPTSSDQRLSSFSPAALRPSREVAGSARHSESLASAARNSRHSSGSSTATAGFAALPVGVAPPVGDVALPAGGALPVAAAPL